MHDSMKNPHRWSVILAGGDGVRLRPLTRLVSGDDRPKQFCRLVGEQSLLAQTRARSAHIVSPERTQLVFTKIHERYFQEELAADPAPSVIVQPENRGTAPAILWSLLELSSLDKDAVVAFFPSDHHYSRERRFLAGVRRAFQCAERNLDSVVILGAKPTYAEVSYGWIELGRRRSSSLRPVSRFWEKPALDVAEKLLESGCLWNTFVMVGSVRAFLAMVEETTQHLYRTFRTLALAGTEYIGEAYRSMEDCDFARQVLSRSGNRLLALSLGDVGWSDLGDPRRAIAVLSERRIPAHGAALAARLSAVAG
jgi:mannose-1-phosphate guanylyltransferase